MPIAYFTISVATLVFCVHAIFLLRLPYKIKITCIWEVPECEPRWRPADNILDFIERLCSQESNNSLNTLFEDHA